MLKGQSVMVVMTRHKTAASCLPFWEPPPTEQYSELAGLPNVWVVFVLVFC